jgi:hypothetical protein
MLLNKPPKKNTFSIAMLIGQHLRATAPLEDIPMYANLVKDARKNQAVKNFHERCEVALGELGTETTGGEWACISAASLAEKSELVLKATVIPEMVEALKRRAAANRSKSDNPERSDPHVPAGDIVMMRKKLLTDRHRRHLATLDVLFHAFFP